MNVPTSNHRFIVLDKAIKAATLILEIVEQVPPDLNDLARQLRRSATAVPANLAEGNGKPIRARRHSWNIALTEAQEADAELRMLMGRKAVDLEKAMRAWYLMDEVRAMTYRLLNPKERSWT